VLHDRLVHTGVDETIATQEYPTAALLAEMEVTGAFSAVDDQRPSSSCSPFLPQSGVCFRDSVLRQHREQIQLKIAALEREACDLLGHPVLLSSPEQVAMALFDELKLPQVRLRFETDRITGTCGDCTALWLQIDSQKKRFAKGQQVNKRYHTTSETVLLKLVQHHRLPSVVLAYRHLQKQLTTCMPACSSARLDAAVLDTSSIILFCAHRYRSVSKPGGVSSAAS